MNHMINKFCKDHNSRHVIIGIVGPFNSGCSTIANYLSNDFGFKKISLASIVKDRFNNMDKEFLKNNQKKFGAFINIDHKRQVLQSIGNFLRYNNGDIRPYILSEIVNSKIKLKSNNYVITGFRRPEEILYFKKLYQDQFYLLGVNSTYEDRLSRYKKNSIKKFDKEIFDFEDLRDSNEYPIPKYGQRVQECYYHADYYIFNTNEDKKDPKDSIGGFVKGAIHNFLNCISSKDPSAFIESNEIGMAYAYLATINSKCLKRFVGAAIFNADERLHVSNNELLSVGYNSPPEKGTKCDQKNGCYRDNLKTKFKCENCDNEILDRKFCLYCAQKIDSKITLPRWLDECKSIHAEERAILSIAKKRAFIGNNLVLYTTTYPCYLCAKTILEFGIRKIIYMEPYPMASSKELLTGNVIEVIYSGISPKSLYKLSFGENLEKIPK